MNFSYDQSRFGRLDSVRSNDGTYGVNTYYGYDAFDRITSKSQSNNAITAWTGVNYNLSVLYSYTLGNKLKTMTLPSGRLVDYQYNTAGQLTGIKVNGTDYLYNVSYNGGQLTGWKWDNTAREYIIRYDELNTGRIKEIRNNNSVQVAGYSVLYNYDRDGRITSIARQDGSKDLFSYDQADHLLSESRVNANNVPFYSINYSYDRNGNRTSLRATGDHQHRLANVDYSYTGNRLTGMTDATLSYSGHAELSYGEFTPAYDAAGNRRFNFTLGGDDLSQQNYMLYNHKHERVLRAYRNNGSSWKTNTVQYVYDEDSHLLGEYDANGTALIEYIWLGDKPVAAIYGTGTNTKTYWIVTDAQNTPRRLLDSVGYATVWSWNSTAFGVAPPTLETVKFNLRFPGQYYDELTKQYYNHNRYYNPELGRYMEPDPIGLEGGSNPYTYALNNPIMYVDSTGAIATPIITGLIGGVIGGGASLGVQIMKNKGLQNIKWQDVGVAASVGAVAGAISPWTAHSAIGAVITGSGANMAAYGLTQKVNNEPTTTAGWVVSGALGAIGGKLSGAVPQQVQRSSIRVAESPFISKVEAAQVNRNVNLNSAIDNIDRYFTLGGVGGGIVAGDPLGMSSYNIRVNQMTLNQNQYGAFKMGNVGNDPLTWTGQPYRLPTITCVADRGCW